MQVTRTENDIDNLINRPSWCWSFYQPTSNGVTRDSSAGSSRIENAFPLSFEPFPGPAKSDVLPKNDSLYTDLFIYAMYHQYRIGCLVISRRGSMTVIKCDTTELEPNKAINIVPEEDMRLIQAEKICSGKGAIEFRWLPTPGYYFIIQGEDQNITVGDAVLKGNGIGAIDVTVRWIKNERGNLICEGPLRAQVRYGDETGEIEKLCFCLPNFGIDPEAPLIISYKNWEVLLRRFENISSLFEKLDKEGGYAFTYKCCIRYNGGSPFTWDQAKFLIGPLRMFLSFVRGAMCSPLFPVGVKAGAEGENDILVFAIHPNSLLPPAWALSRWQGLPNWCDQHSQQDLSDAFTRFMDLYTMGKLASPYDYVDVFDHLAAIIYMYVEAGLTSFGETTIMLTQSALESLAYMQAEKCLDKISFSSFDDDRAENKIRWMLNKLHIPTDIPPEAKELQDYLNGKSLEAPLDGVKGITYFRNGIIHANTKFLKRTFGTSADLAPSEKAMEKAIILGRMYIELAVLHMLNYKGMYTDRFTKNTRQVDMALS